MRGEIGPAKTSARVEGFIPNPKLKLLDQVSEVMRFKHYSLRTETTYLEWIKRYIFFHGKRHPREMGAFEVERFLSHLAVNRKVAGSTQNQDFDALVFLFREALGRDLGDLSGYEVSRRPARVPTVLTPEEARRVIEAMNGVPQLVVKLIYGSGLRVLEALRLQVHYMGFEMKLLTVRGPGSIHG